MSIIQLRASKQTYKNNPTFTEGRFFVLLLLKVFLLRHLTFQLCAESFSTGCIKKRSQVSPKRTLRPGRGPEESWARGAHRAGDDALYQEERSCCAVRCAGARRLTPAGAASNSARKVFHRVQNRSRVVARRLVGSWTPQGGR